MPAAPVHRHVVTGAGRGIGFAIARHQLALGHRVVLVDRDADALGEALRALPAGARAAGRCLDVGDETAVDALFTELAGDGLGLAGLVNNAGIADPHSGPPEALALADWERWLRSNLTGAFLCARGAIPLLREQRGAMVNVASTRALQSEPECEAYAASKGGLLALTHALAVSLGPAVRVNAVSPGWIDTRHSPAGPPPAPLDPEDHALHPTGRVGRPEDVAEAVAWLLDSERSGFLTGENVVLDGGMTRLMRY
ncbi:SDR family oxidoreductase [Spiribacter halobius]|uniref:Oxidoreductase n=1 Tax=Sediminicurvatus halobius TaxID=2182432 RepID=A0A2U2N630_9GAMM|nr:SDR family oxidoreductase [Spiribacter halobius]PWG64675.1 hypothetical protein DEM34_04940 [Spiribacter halobius]UEX79000.1 SDR family oxidoreductase [Spiribacter halobius]